MKVIAAFTHMFHYAVLQFILHVLSASPLPSQAVSVDVTGIPLPSHLDPPHPHHPWSKPITHT